MMITVNLIRNKFQDFANFSSVIKAELKIQVNSGFYPIRLKK